MSDVADMLTPDAVLLHLKARSFDDALQQISAHAAETTGLRTSLILEALRERTAQGVGLGGGVAIPHARLAGLRRVTAFFARPVEPIAMPDGELVKFLFVLLAPQDAHGAHLKALAQVARVLRSGDTATLHCTTDRHEAYAILVAA